MVSSVLIFISFFLIFNQTLSIKIGKIQHVSIKSNATIRQSFTNHCTDCLCDCIKSSSTSPCSGINCFPSNGSCQLLDEDSWILESNTLINITSNNYLAIKENTSRLCSCYTPQRILDYYSQINQTTYSSTTDMRSIKYIPNDNSLIALNTTLIRKLFATNLTIIRSLSSLNDISISILHNDTKIFIAFAGNSSINMYDLNLTLLYKSNSWLSQASNNSFAGMFLHDNKILIMDQQHSKIWSIYSLNDTTLTLFFDFLSFNVLFPLGLFIYQNRSLYISSLGSSLYLFNLTYLTLKQTFSLPVANIYILFMRYDSNCDRLWFGTTNYTYAPVLDLTTNQMSIHQTTGIISKAAIYSIDFDFNYMSFYTDMNGHLRQMHSSDINC